MTRVGLDDAIAGIGVLRARLGIEATESAPRDHVSPEERGRYRRFVGLSLVANLATLLALAAVLPSTCARAPRGLAR